MDSEQRWPAAEAAAKLRGLIHGLRSAQALYVAAELGIADHLVAGALTATELSDRTAVDADALGRLMRALCALDVFAEISAGRFALNSVSQRLRSETDDSYRAVVLLLAGPARWRCWATLSEAVKQGKSVAGSVLGGALFDHYADNPALSKIHDDAMRTLSVMHATSIVDAIDFSDVRIAVDVGGGTGQLLAAALTAHPQVSGILYDLPNVVLHAPEVMNQVSDRCEIESGSFFERVPDGGDLYLLKQVIHDWDDERAITILRCCRRNMPPTARLLIVERRMPVAGERSVSAEPFFLDLEMLVMTPGGRERTEADFRRLLAQSGFKLASVLQTASPFSVFEALPR